MQRFRRLFKLSHFFWPIMPKYNYSKIFTTKQSIESANKQQPKTIKRENAENKSIDSNEQKRINQLKFSRLLEYLYSIPADKVLVLQKHMDDCQIILKDLSITLQTKEEAFNLMKFLVRVKVSQSTFHFQRQKNDLFEIYQTIPGNHEHFAKACEALLVRTNLSLKDNDLLFDTIYFLPHIIQESMALHVYMQEYLRNFGHKMNISLFLFFMSRLVIYTKSENTPISMLNEAFKRYSEIKEDLFDLGMILFCYYESLSKYYMTLHKLEKRQSAQHISINLENGFRSRQHISLKDVCRNPQDENKIFQEIVMQDIMDLIAKYENGQIKIPKAYFIQGLIFVLKSLARFKIIEPNFLRKFEELVSKYQTSLSLNDKIQLLLTFAKNLSVIPAFMRDIEIEIYHGLKHLVWQLRYKPKLTLVKSCLDSVYSSPQFYDHIKIRNQTYSSDMVYPEFCAINIEDFVTIDSISEYYWCIAKLNLLESAELVKLSNNLVNLQMDLYTKYQMVDVLQAACAISLNNYEGVDWAADIRNKVECLSLKIRDWDPSNSQKPLIVNISNLFKSISFIQLKFGIQMVPNYFTPQQMEFFRKDWFKSIQRFRISKFETQVAEIVQSYFKENNIKKKVQQNKLADIYLVDILIEPDIVIEINGKFHFLQDSSMRICRESYFGNYAVKIAHLSLKKFKLIMLECYEYEAFQNNEKKLKEYIIKKIQPVLEKSDQTTSLS